MGTCLSKKKPSSSSSYSSSVLNSFNIALSSSVQASTVVVPVQDPTATKPKKEKPKQSPPPQQDQQLLAEEHASVAPAKKEVFLIKHRKSHDDRDRNSKPATSDHDDLSADSQQQQPATVASAATPAQIRTSSCTKEELDAILIQCGRLSRSSSGKAASSSATTGGGGRRYSGSKRSFDFDNSNAADGASRNEITAEEDEDEEKRARERERQQRRSRHSPSPQGRRRRTPSREREKDSNSNQRSSSRERRVSRSPGRRGPTADSSSDSVLPSARPGKMVSVPATVTDKSNNGEPTSGSVKRITVKRNVGDPAGARTKAAASPRTQSPARAAANESQGAASLSRNSSRKAEISPYRRNPLSEIDPNTLVYPNRSQSRGKREIEGSDDTILNQSVQTQKPNVRSNSSKTTTVETTVVTESKPQTVTRTRSARRSRDLDINPEALLEHPNPVPSYTRLLLEDINNFHQKNSTPTPTVVTLPACVTKACSILEAVADLNNNNNNGSASAASSNLDQYNKTYNNLGNTKDPFVESEISCCDDLTEPSFHKYVTVRRGAGVGSVDAEDQESSGSNSFAGGSGSQISSWGLSPSSSSAECWTSRSREEERSSGRKRESYSGGIGRGRLGSAAKGLHATTTTSVVVE